jgi:hypothetical protein
MQWMERHRVRWVAGVLLLAALALAPSAFAGDRRGGVVRGEHHLTSKNDAKQTLQLEDVTLQIDPLTRIYDGDSRRIAFHQIMNPAPRAPILVAYEGREVNGVVAATKIVVRLEPL